MSKKLEAVVKQMFRALDSGDAGRDEGNTGK